MKGFYTDHFVLPLPPGHRFPMEKYALLRNALEGMPGIRLEVAPATSDEELTLAHADDYVSAIAKGTISQQQMREIGFPWSEAMVERSRRSVGATIAACHTALLEGAAGNLAGGTHHASKARGGGFCVFNDAAVATRSLQKQAVAKGLSPLRVAIIDLDVHQGNGTADIFAGDASVFTLSVHGAKNFPFRKSQSDLDVELADGCSDAQYLDAMSGALKCLDQRFEPQLAIYLAGADPHEGDRLGRLKLSVHGLLERDRLVFDWASRRRVPVAFTMAGGYGKDLSTMIQVQLNTWAAALSFFRSWNESHPFHQVARQAYFGL